MSEQQLSAGISVAGLLTCLVVFSLFGPGDTVKAADPATANAEVQAFENGDTSVFSGGAPLRLFMWKTVTSSMIYGQGGSRLRSFTIEQMLVLLPRGVLLSTYTGKDKVGSWRAAGSALEVTLDGKNMALRLGRGPNGQVSATLDGPRGAATYWEVARPNDSRLAGRYETLYSAGSGGGGVPVISSEGKKALVLTPDHRFELSGASSTTAIDKRSVTAARNGGVLRGQWRYDPASFILTLQPEGGQPVLKGPTFPSAAWSQGDAPNSDWSILGVDRWWRAASVATPSK